MKAKPLSKLVHGLICALVVLTYVWTGARAADAPKEKTEEKATRPKDGKGEKRRESAALKDLREELEKTRHELEKARESLHDAHKELGSKAESISSLEAKLSSLTSQLEKAREELKKSTAAAGTIEKQTRQLEAGRKQLAGLQKDIKVMEAKAAALAAAKKPSQEKKPSKSDDPRPETTRKETAPAKVPTIDPILYEAASAVNYPERDRALAEVAEALKKFPNAKVEITGHADDSIHAQTNQDVSDNRAKFLASYFEIQGIPGDRIVTRGLGDTKPIKGKPNRRVEISIIP